MKKLASAMIPSLSGDFHVTSYAGSDDDRMPHLAIAHPEVKFEGVPLVRVHSECFTGDVLGSKRCDCGEQLKRALKLIHEEKGILLYLRQEGRGIGLTNKLKAYNLQDKGLNTIDANHQLGFEADERTYDIATHILHDLGVHKIRLLTNNPLKVESLKNGGIEIVERVSIQIQPTADNKAYLKTKKDLMGHILD
jgi:3,4-dihydroxy 2-butanone 4-phosphate synthase / GTP cyclohydrolase II